MGGTEIAAVEVIKVRVMWRVARARRIRVRAARSAAIAVCPMIRVFAI
jgi:hypothetical protein